MYIPTGMKSVMAFSIFWSRYVTVTLFHVVKLSSVTYLYKRYFHKVPGPLCTESKATSLLFITKSFVPSEAPACYSLADPPNRCVREVVCLTDDMLASSASFNRCFSPRVPRLMDSNAIVRI